MTKGLRRKLAAAAMVTAVLAMPVPAAAMSQMDAVAPPVINTSTPVFTVGTPVTFTFSPDGLGTPAVKYQYQVNDGRIRTVRAQAGQASVAITPTARTSRLKVEGIGADGGLSGSVIKIYLARLTPPAADKDVNGDGNPDLLVAGDLAVLGSGIWQTTGRTGDPAPWRLRVPAVNIGQEGIPGIGPEAFDGAQLITGNFLGNGYQDVFAYLPGGIRAGGGFIISGSGDGSPLWPHSGNELNVFSGFFSDMNGDSPRQLANAYNASGASPYIPDLIGISGSANMGYRLNFYPNQGEAVLNYYAVQLSNPTPAGGIDWENWRLASLSLSTGTAMFLWNTATGALYLWEQVTFADNGDGTGAVVATQYLISEHWIVDPASVIQAADFGADGVPDLWVVSPSACATAHVVSGLSETGPARITAKAPQNLA